MQYQITRPAGNDGLRGQGDMAKRTGRQTPTRSAVLPYEATKGDVAVKLYSLSGREMMPWQCEQLRNIMAVTPAGLWAHTRYGYAVSRRNGKTEIIYARVLSGLVAGEKIMYTAHRTSTSHNAWENIYALLKAVGVPIINSYRALGREHIYVAGGGRIEFRTRTAKGGLGEGYDLLIIDEAQEYQDDQETALKYIVTASRNPQTILLGTPPTAVSSGTVFSRFRDEVLAGRAENAGWAEWSVPAETDPQNKEAWYETNPSLGIILTERNIAAEITGDTLDFNIQRLGLWVHYEIKSEITEAEWLAMRCTAPPKLTGKLCAGIKFGKDGMKISLSVAAKTDNGDIFVETVDSRSQRDGLSWVLDFLAKAELDKVVIDGAGGQQILQEQMKRQGIRPKPTLPTVKEVITANATFEQELSARHICHMAQPGLTASVSNCEKRKIGSTGGFGYRSIRDDVDITPMESMILALWAVTTQRERKKQAISY